MRTATTYTNRRLVPLLLYGASAKFAKAATQILTDVSVGLRKIRKGRKT